MMTKFSADYFHKIYKNDQTPLFKCNRNPKLVCANYPQQLLTLSFLFSPITVESTEKPFQNWLLWFLLLTYRFLRFLHLLERLRLCLPSGSLNNKKTITGAESHLTKDTCRHSPFITIFPNKQYHIFFGDVLNQAYLMYSVNGEAAPPASPLVTLCRMS